jgi:hypothetical protein
MGEYDKKIEGQCGTCRFALAFDYASSPSGPEDGVHCNSERMAKNLADYHRDDSYQQELQEYGFMDLWRLEALGDETDRCEFWESKE